MQEQSSLPAALCSVASLVPKKRQRVSSGDTKGTKSSPRLSLDLSLDLEERAS